MNASRPSKNPAARQPARATPASPDDRAAASDVTIRAVRRADLDAVIALDAQTTGIEKRDYWRALYRRYGEATAAERQFLVAVSGKAVVGYVIGEVRDWEFGSPPCGWVFAINVAPALRQSGTGSRLLEAVCAGFRATGTSTVRTMLARGDTLILSFFRSQGMTAGPFIPLEMSLVD